MNVDNYISALGNISYKPAVSESGATETEDTFGNFFDAALKLVEETNAYQREADQLQMDFAAGKTDDMLGLMLAQEKAYSSLNFTVQVTNKIIEAYREIIRIQL